MKTVAMESFVTKIQGERRNVMEKMPMPEYTMIYGPEVGEPEPPEISEVERLINEFEAHEAHEKKIVDRYREITEKSKNPFLNFLLRLIISDEEKHYQVTHAMLSTLKGDLTWTRPEDAIRGFADLVEGKGELLGLTDEFIRIEKEGIKEYKTLIKVCKGYYRGLFVLLFQSMIRDSEKHIEVLDFLKSKLKEV